MCVFEGTGWWRSVAWCLVSLQQSEFHQHVERRWHRVAQWHCVAVCTSSHPQVMMSHPVVFLDEIPQKFLTKSSGLLLCLPTRVQSTAISVCVCLHVCQSLSVISHISQTACPNFTKFFVRVTSGHGSVLLWWRRCYTLCTSGFVDYQPSCHPSLRRIHSSAALFVAPVENECIVWGESLLLGWWWIHLYYIYSGVDCILANVGLKQGQDCICLSVHVGSKTTLCLATVS